MQDDEDFALAEKFVGHPDVIMQLAAEFKRIRAEARAAALSEARALQDDIDETINEADERRLGLR